MPPPLNLEKKMIKLENTNPQSVNVISTSDETRCQRRRPSGRRCKLPVVSPGAPFCLTHTKEFNKADILDLKPALLTNHQGFQTAQGINHSLGNLYKLLANNYISPRRAAVLAYINSLQLRTLPAIDADNDAGIADPTIPVSPKRVRAKSAVTKPATLAASPSSAPPEPDSDAKSASMESGSTETNAEHSAASPSEASTTHDPAPPSKYRSYWATIPDPAKKPS
jgi:hypothetical protein